MTSDERPRTRKKTSRRSDDEGEGWLIDSRGGAIPRCAKWEFCASRSPKVSGNDGYRFESVEGSLREVERTVRERAP